MWRSALPIDHLIPHKKLQSGPYVNILLDRIILKKKKKVAPHLLDILLPAPRVDVQLTYTALGKLYVLSILKYLTQLI